MTVKHFQATGVKFADETDGEATGAFEAVFATLGVKDKDGDVIVAGSIEAGKEVLVMPQHKWSELPIGKATISERGNELIATGTLFLDTPQGDQAYRTMKAVGSLQEWSFGFNVLEANGDVHNGERVNVLKRMDVFEVSPVMIGAGVNTRTLAMKAAGCECGGDCECPNSDGDDAEKGSPQGRVAYEVARAWTLGSAI